MMGIYFIYFYFSVNVPSFDVAALCYCTILCTWRDILLYSNKELRPLWELLVTLMVSLVSNRRWELLACDYDRSIRKGYGMPNSAYFHLQSEGTKAVTFDNKIYSKTSQRIMAHQEDMMADENLHHRRNIRNLQKLPEHVCASFPTSDVWCRGSHHFFHCVLGQKKKKCHQRTGIYKLLKFNIPE